MQEAHAQRPLAGHALFQSNDLDEARERVAAVFCPHRLDTIGRGAKMAARHHHLRGDRVSLNYIEYGAKTLIAPGTLERFYLMQIPLCGGAAIANGADRYVTGPGQAAVLNPQVPTTMIWEEGTRQVLVQIDRRALMEHLSAQLGHRADETLAFQGPMDLTTGAGATLRQMVMFLLAEADQGRVALGAGLMGRQVEGMLISGLLEFRFDPGSPWTEVLAALFGVDHAAALRGTYDSAISAARVLEERGGVLAIAGDDPSCKSSSLCSQSEPMLFHVGIPSVYPANVQEILDYGLHGWALSRYSGCWVARSSRAPRWALAWSWASSLPTRRQKAFGCVVSVAA